MNRWTTFAGGLAALSVLSAGAAFAQQPTAPQPAAAAKECDPARVPQSVEGQVVTVDRNTNKVTIRDSRGTTHEFQANAETARDMKPGDRIEARLRQAPNCQGRVAEGASRVPPGPPLPHRSGWPASRPPGEASCGGPAPPALPRPHGA
jgi:hypothetical protein